MKLNAPNYSNIFEQPDSKINVYFYLDGKEYEIESFQIVFGQSPDHKGQPQQDTKGGQFILSMSQMVDDNIYDWGRRADKRKNGVIKFMSETSGTKLEIEFIEAYCTSLKHKINAFSGTETLLAIAPRIVKMNGFAHDNKWRSE